jgi:hypothetical protein
VTSELPKPLPHLAGDGIIPIHGGTEVASQRFLSFPVINHPGRIKYRKLVLVFAGGCVIPCMTSVWAYLIFKFMCSFGAQLTGFKVGCCSGDIRTVRVPDWTLKGDEAHG